MADTFQDDIEKRLDDEDEQIMAEFETPSTFIDRSSTKFSQIKTDDEPSFQLHFDDDQDEDNDNETVPEYENDDSENETESKKSSYSKAAIDDLFSENSSEMLKSTESLEKSMKNTNRSKTQHNSISKVDMTSDSIQRGICHDDSYSKEDARNSTTIYQDFDKRLGASRSNIDDDSTYESRKSTPSVEKKNNSMSTYQPNATTTESAKTVDENSSRKMFASNNMFVSSSSDEFVRKGTRLRHLINSVLTKVVHNAHKRGRPLPNFDRDSSESDWTTHDPPKSKRLRTQANGMKRSKKENCNLKHARELAREKMSTCVILERKLEEARSENQTLQNQISSLQTANKETTSKLNRVLEALRIAGTKVASAKAEKDASQARAKHLSNQLVQIQTSVKDTIEDCNKVKLEHEEIMNMSRDLQARLMTSNVELGRNRRDCAKLKEEKENLHVQYSEMQIQYELIKENLKEMSNDLEKEKKTATAKKAMEQKRALQLETIEKELRQARSSLLQASNTTADSESTVSLLKETIQELMTENEKLHKSIQNIIENGEKEQKKKDNAMILVESQVQQLKIKNATGEEELKRVKLDKDETEKYVEQLKNKVINLEKRLVDKQYQNLEAINEGERTGSGNGVLDVPRFISSLLPSKLTGNENLDKIVTKDKDPIPNYDSYSSKKNIGLETKKILKQGGSFLFAIPGNDKISPRKKNENSCSLCSKKPFGLMKSCQCGKLSCGKRAHAACLAGKARELNCTVAEVSTLCNIN